ncbi:MAG TPA: dockerin type I domain-containing protein, partial [Pirellulales bacterium]|nr:dockerin type I domain-containing protein [Pirellulales bacterium]
MWANFHFWKIDQIYSNASGTVQFVELGDTSNGETVVGGKTLTSSSGQTFTFPSDLPAGTATAGHHMLLATPGYNALNGATKADFTLPAHFLNTSGDTLNYASGFDSVSFGDSQLPMLPVDNLHSLNRSAPSQSLLSGVNFATDLAGNSGQIPPWENQDNPLDVDGNGKVQAHDALLIINELLDHGTHSLAAPTSGNAPPPFLDVVGNNTVAPIDANRVITFLLDNPTANVVPTTAFSAPTVSMSMPMASATMQIVPEPTSEALAMMGAALLGILGLRRRLQREIKAPFCTIAR